MPTADNDIFGKFDSSPFEEMITKELVVLQKRMGAIINSQKEVLEEVKSLREDNLRLKRLLVKQEPDSFADCLERIVLEEFDFQEDNIDIFYKYLSKKKVEDTTVIACRSLLFYVLKRNFDWTIPMLEKRYGYKGRNFADYIEGTFFLNEKNAQSYSNVVNMAYATCDAPEREMEGCVLVADEEDYAIDD